MTTFEVLLKLTDILASGFVGEAMISCASDAEENSQSQTPPSLLDVVSAIEQIIGSLPKDILERYSAEILSLNNQLIDCKEGRYYECLQRRGVPKLSTIGKRTRDILIDLADKVANDKPGNYELFCEIAAKTELNIYNKDLRDMRPN